MAKKSKRPKHDNFSGLSMGCRTDIGCIRDHNEDSLLAQDPLFVVADGMGGHAAGEVASEIAIESMDKNAPRVADPAALAAAVEGANHEIIQAAMEGRGKQGMGTTMTAAVVDGEVIAIAQVGDSRAYLLSDDKLQQITRDHSLMADMIEAGQITPAEARVHPNRSLITRALGSDPNMYADTYEINVKSGDRLLLCSDGLSSMLTDDEIKTILLRTENPQSCADKLVDAAIAAGGADNITVIVVDISGFSAKRKRKTKNKIRRNFIIVGILLVAIIAGAIAAGYFIVKNSAYLTSDDGYVAVYEGVAGNFLGFELSHKVEKTDVCISDLRQTTQDHFKDGVIKVDGIDAAWSIVDNYRSEAEEQKSYKKSTSSSSSQSSSSQNTSTQNSSNQNSTAQNSSSTTQNNAQSNVSATNTGASNSTN